MKSLYVMTAALTLIASASQAEPRLPANAPAGEKADTTIYRLQPDMGGAPNDGNLWRASETMPAPNGVPGSTLTLDVVANTPIPDTPENRKLFGEPLSRSGELTAAKPGPAS